MEPTEAAPPDLPQLLLEVGGLALDVDVRGRADVGVARPEAQRPARSSATRARPRRTAAVALSYAAMTTLELTDEELKLLREALKSFLDDFGHKEAEIVAEIQALLAKLPPRETA
jgi:hypothetical protein